jgi:hypothetical protein
MRNTNPMPASISEACGLGIRPCAFLQQGCEDHEALLVEGNPSAEATVWTPACATKKHARAPAEELLVRSLSILVHFRAAVCLTSQHSMVWHKVHGKDDQPSGRCSHPPNWVCGLLAGSLVHRRGRRQRINELPLHHLTVRPVNGGRQSIWRLRPVTGHAAHHSQCPPRNCAFRMRGVRS